MRNGQLSACGTYISNIYCQIPPLYRSCDAPPASLHRAPPQDPRRSRIAVSVSLNTPGDQHAKSRACQWPQSTLTITMRVIILRTRPFSRTTTREATRPQRSDSPSLRAVNEGVAVRKGRHGRRASRFATRRDCGLGKAHAVTSPPYRPSRLSATRYPPST